MARFKKTRRFARRSFGKARRYGKSNSGMKAEELAIGSALYGAGRPFIANMVPDIGVLGQYSDNIVMGGLGYLAVKKGSGMIKKAGMVVLANEAFLVGAKVTNSMSNQSGQTTGSW